MDKIPAPENFDFTTPKLATRWHKWKEEFKLYIELAMEGKDDKVKAKMCLYLMGTTGREIYETIKPAPASDATDSAAKVDELLKMFDTYCNPKQNETIQILYTKPRAWRANRQIRYRSESTSSDVQF